MNLIEILIVIYYHQYFELFLIIVNVLVLIGLIFVYLDLFVNLIDQFLVDLVYELIVIY